MCTQIDSYKAWQPSGLVDRPLQEPPPVGQQICPDSIHAFAVEAIPVDDCTAPRDRVFSKTPMQELTDL